MPGRSGGWRCVAGVLTALAAITAVAREPIVTQSGDGAAAVESPGSIADDLAVRGRLALDAMSPGERSDWGSLWPRFAGAFRMTDEGPVVLPTYSRRYENSTAQSAAAARGSLDASIDTRDRNGEAARRSVSVPLAEGRALSRILPDLALGSYGWVESVEVGEVVGPRDAVVTSVRLIDLDALRERKRREMDDASGREERDEVDVRYAQREAVGERQRDRAYRTAMRLSGFETAGLIPGERYAGPGGEGLHVAVVRVEDADDGPSRVKPRRVLLSVEAYRKAPRLDEAQFAGWLARVGMTPAELVERYRAARRIDRDRAEAAVFRQLVPPQPGPGHKE
ncbi:MAG: hypothetical protein AAGA57_02555 [Planctomycetota bacterium]